MSGEESRPPDLEDLSDERFLVVYRGAQVRGDDSLLFAFEEERRRRGLAAPAWHGEAPAGGGNG